MILPLMQNTVKIKQRKPRNKIHLKLTASKSNTKVKRMKYYSSKNFVLFKSIESTYNKLLEALKDKSVCMIGLCGIGGSGKTTLTKEVGKKAEDLQLFEKVVMVTVSQTPNIRSIQEQIADQLDFKLREDSNIGVLHFRPYRASKGAIPILAW